MKEVSKTAREKIAEGMSKGSGFGGETDFAFDGMKITKLTPERIGELSRRKKEALKDSVGPTESGSGGETDKGKDKEGDGGSEQKG